MVIDILFALFLVAGFISGYRKGIVHSIFAVLALFFGLMVALRFSHDLAVVLYEWFNTGSALIPFIAFLLLFIGVCIVLRVLSWLVEKVLNLVFLGFFNQLAGGILWLVIMTLIFSTVLWFFNQMNFISPEVKAGSFTYNYLITLAPLVIDFTGDLMPFIEGIFDAFENLFEEQARKDSRVVMNALLLR